MITHAPMICHGIDSTRPVSVSPATGPGERALIQQPLSVRKNAAGNIVYTYYIERIDSGHWEQSNADAIARAESINNGMNLTYAESEIDDG